MGQGCYQPGVPGMGEVSPKSQTWTEPAWGPRDGAESGCHRRQRTVEVPRGGSGWGYKAVGGGGGGGGWAV